MGKADMRFLNLFKGPDINEGLRTLQKTEGAVLLDVRTLLPGDEAEIAAALAAWREERA